VISIVTNIDADHMETYGHDFGRLKQAFVDFLQRLPFYGVAVLCADDANVREIMPQVSKQIVTYGLDAGRPTCVPRTSSEDGQMRFDCVRVNGSISRCRSRSICRGCTTSSMRWRRSPWPPKSASRCRDHQGAGRVQGRRSALPALRRVALPMAAASRWSTTTAITRSKCARPRRRARRLSRSPLLLAFQPHRYTRTRDCFEDFVKVLNTVDALVLAEVYAAGEAPIVAADGRAGARLARRRQGRAGLRREHRDVPQAILDVARDGDVVITMGAGSIGGVPGKLVAG
jgi:UDP-N-acetylmuramate--alanine ligase